MRGSLTSLAIAALFAPAAVAQPPDTQPQPPLFRAGVELVRLDVRVTDSNGRPIEDLRPDEIEVVEAGQPRPIVLFQHIHEPREPYVEAARRTVAGEVSTNQGAPRGHLYVLVFDQQHITTGNEQRARLAAERFLKTRVRPSDRAALFALTGPGPQINFTSNVDLLVAELPKVRGSLERSVHGGLGPMRIYEAYEVNRGSLVILDRVANRLAAQTGATDVLAAAGSASPASAVTGNTTFFQMLVKEDARTLVARADQQARDFLRGLSELVRSLRRIEGRKNVVLISEGFFSDNVTRELEQVAASAAQSYSVLYALDLNRRENDVREAEPLGGDQFNEIQSRLAPLGSLAVETDGALFNDATSWIEQAFDRIADASHDYYIIGFEPPAAALTDRRQYRRVTVRVRRDGAQVSARTGYALHDEPTPADRRRAIDTALAAPYSQQGLPIEYTTYVLRGAKPGLHRVVLSLAADLPVASEGQPQAADVVFVVRSARDARVVASGTDTLALPETLSAGASTGRGTYRVQFEAPPGEYLMRVVVREPGGLVGSADRRFDVRPLETMDVTASDLILGSKTIRLPVRAIGYAGGVLDGALELYARAPEQLEEVEVTVDLARLGGRAAQTSVRADLGDVVQTDRGSSRAVKIELPLEGIEPGEYVARAIVRARGETVRELAREIQVLPGPPPAGEAAPTPSPTGAAAPNPAAVLDGELGRRFVAALRAAGGTPALVTAAEHAARGDWNQVEEAAGPLEPDPPAAHGALAGLARFARRDFPGAAAALEQAFRANPRDALTAFFLGWARASMGDDRQAVGAWRAAAFLDASLVPAHLALADAYLRLAEPALAAQALRAGLAALPGSPELLDRLARMGRQ